MFLKVHDFNRISKTQCQLSLYKIIEQSKTKLAAAADPTQKYVNISLLGGEVVRKTNRGVGFKFTLCMHIVNMSVRFKMRKIMFLQLNTNIHFIFQRYECMI